MSKENSMGVFAKITNMAGMNRDSSTPVNDQNFTRKNEISSKYKDLYRNIVQLSLQIEEDIEAAKEGMGIRDLNNIHDVLSTSTKNIGNYYDKLNSFKTDKRPISQKLPDFIKTTHELIQFVDDLVIKYRRQHPSLSDSIRSTRDQFIPIYMCDINELVKMIDEYYIEINKTLPDNFENVYLEISTLKTRMKSHNEE